MTDQLPAPPPSYERRPPTEGGTPRRRLHTVAASLIAGYLVAAACVVAAHDLIAMPEWLALHLLVLGAASNAILVYTRHFAQALLHARAGSESAARIRLAVFNLGGVSVLIGIPVHLLWLVVAGASLAVVAVIAHTVSLVAMTRAASLSGRLRIVVWYYVAAGVALVVGATLGALLASGVAGSIGWQEALRLSHAHLNLLGWLGLVVIGTLFMLWPAALRTRMAETAPRFARRALVITVVSLAVTVTGTLLTGLLAQAHWLAAAGMAGYAVGVAYSLWPAIAEMRAKPPRSAAPVALLAGNGWLLVALIVDVVALALGAARADDLLDRLLVPMLGIGVIAQILIAALTFLIPVMVGGGPVGNRRITEVLEYAWLPRALVGNIGVLLLVLPIAGGTCVLAWVLVLAGFASFPALVVAALLAVRRTPSQTTAASQDQTTSETTDSAGATGRRRRLAGHEILAITSVAVVLAVLALVGNTWSGHTASATNGSAVTATSGVPVSVTLTEFAVAPSTLTVSPGTDLVVKVRNAGQMDHNLALDSKHITRMLAPGQQQTVDMGVVTRDEVLYCTIPGHREAGMTLTVRTTTSTAMSTTAPAPTTQQSPGTVTNMASAPPPTWRPYDPALRPVAGGTEHDVTLHVQHATIEVAPGVRQQVWTYNGTVPGPVLHGRVGDVFTVHLINDSDMPHSIDFHASQVDPGTAMRTIPGGGQSTYQFRAEHAGIWLYHCGTAPLIEHVAMGMYGAVVIDPPNLDPVANSDVFVQSEFYLGQGGGIPTMSQLVAADPNLVVFNGYANQYRYAPIHVKVGQRIRLWVMDAGPNSPSAFHVVGAQFDTVFKEGAYLLLPGNAADGGAQQLDLEPGEGGFVEFTLKQPGTYTILTHRLADAQRGAVGSLIADP